MKQEDDLDPLVNTLFSRNVSFKVVNLFVSTKTADLKRETT